MPVYSYPERENSGVMSEANADRDDSTAENTAPQEPPDPDKYEIGAAQVPDTPGATFLVVPNGTDDLDGVPGYVINRSEDTIRPVANTLTLMQQGYWEEYDPDDGELEFLLTRTTFEPRSENE